MPSHRICSFVCCAPARDVSGLFQARRAPRGPAAHLPVGWCRDRALRCRSAPLCLALLRFSLQAALRLRTTASPVDCAMLLQVARRRCRLVSVAVQRMDRCSVSHGNRWRGGGWRGLCSLGATAGAVCANSCSVFRCAAQQPQRNTTGDARLLWIRPRALCSLSTWRRSLHSRHGCRRRLRATGRG